MPFIHEDFLLQTPASRRLYREFAADEPIIDFHSHLSQGDIARNRRFRNLFEIWLEGDHYKWRAMRANGVAERFCTGDASPREKFMAWAETVPHTLRNPLYHWTHLELRRYFGIDQLLDGKSAAVIWDRTEEMLASDELSTRGILKKFKVRALCTTDDPSLPLTDHEALAAEDFGCRVFPTFRPDKALGVDQPAKYREWVAALAKADGREISSFAQFLAALRSRHDAFHAVGGRLSDHGLERCPALPCTETEALATFERALNGTAASAEEWEKFATFMMVYFGRLDAERGWTKQIHVGAMRNNNSRLLGQLGPDTGFDSIGDFSQGRALSIFLDLLDRENALPKTILYNLNPADNYVFATVLGSFQDGSIAGKIQLGSGWWFLDQKEGMEWQMNALSNLGLLSRFVGMVTDSRSFMSFPRHEYFRRVLCNLIGRDVENGEIPDDLSLLGPLLRNICSGNARNFLGLATA